MVIPDIKLNKVEEFKNFDISRLFKKEYNLSIGGNTDLHNLDQFYNIHIVNGVCSSYNSVKGVRIRIVKTEPTKKINNLRDITSGINSDLIVIDIDDTPDKPIVLINYYTEDNGLTASNVVVNSSGNNRVDLLEVTISDKSNTAFNNRIFKIDNSNLNYARVDLTESMDGLIYNYNGAVNGGDFKSVMLTNSANIGVNSWNIDLTKAESNANVYSVIDLQGDKKHGNICKLNHLVGDTKSDQEFRHILADSCVSMYDGDSFINNGASGSNSKQYSKAIMLSKDARVYNKPRLNIYNSDVKASHGASVGQLNQEDIFYMKQRGLSEEKVKSILLDAFASDIIDRIDNPVIREFVHDKR